jgi:hypothetical protein
VKGRVPGRMLGTLLPIPEAEYPASYPIGIKASCVKGTSSPSTKRGLLVSALDRKRFPPFFCLNAGPETKKSSKLQLLYPIPPNGGLYKRLQPLIREQVHIILNLLSLIDLILLV